MYVLYKIRQVEFFVARQIFHYTCRIIKSTMWYMWPVVCSRHKEVKGFFLKIISGKINLIGFLHCKNVNSRPRWQLRHIFGSGISCDAGISVIITQMFAAINDCIGTSGLPCQWTLAVKCSRQKNREQFHTSPSLLPNRTSQIGTKPLIRIMGSICFNSIHNG